jgi:signal transduction histidine kinase
LIPSGIKFTLKIDSEASKLKFSMEARRNILLIFKEAINNAAKYSGTDEITCTIEVRDELILCSIRDYGSGFIIPEKESGHGLSTMKKRAVEMNGKLEIMPGSNGGTMVIAYLPLDELNLS